MKTLVRNPDPDSRVSPVVSQSLLEELQRLRRQQNEYQALRRELIQSLDSGAEIEPGPLTVSVERQTQRRITEAKLTALLGTEVVSAWKRDVEPTRTTVLKVAALDRE